MRGLRGAAGYILEWVVLTLNSQLYFTEWNLHSMLLCVVSDTRAGANSISKTKG